MSLLGVDVGTTGAKVLLLETDGRILARVTETYDTSNPHPMWSEQNPEDWWHATCLAIRRALNTPTMKPDTIRGIGLSGQMVGLVTLDDDGQVIRPCIMWNDQRSAREAEESTNHIGLGEILQETSNPLFATFVAPKLIWMRRHEPANYKRIRHFVMPKDYIAYRLTGNIGTEVSDASGTCLFNVRERRWSSKMNRYLDIAEEWLPPCTESDEVAGEISPVAASCSGLRAGTPVIAGAGDQPAQALGSGIVKPGLCSVTIGTSGVVFAQSGEHIQHPEGVLHSFCHGVHGQWYLMGVMLSAGGSFQWLRNLFSSLSPLSYDAMTDLAAAAPPGCEGLVFLPYLSGERCPHDDPRARGGWIGLTQRHGLPHMIRAVMEGITFGLRDSVQLMHELGIPIRKVHASGGAAQSPFWRQLLADVLGTEVATTNVTEGAAYGAAMLAGIGAGEYANAVEAYSTLIQTRETTRPDPDSREKYEETYAVYHSLYPLLRDSFGSLTGLATMGQSQ
jgi:xylulokinase